jgi:tRNA threonylcarbamoyladenosine biosynthesis protein TsaE
MVTLISRNPEETFAVGESWGREAQNGWVIGLTGDLGAGKTQLVKGIARGLGLNNRISSPTFALVNEHAGGRLPLHHLDLYRLNGSAQIIAAGLEGYLTNPEGVTVVEWFERWQDDAHATQVSTAGRLRRVWIDTLSATERCIRHEDSGH